MHKYCELCQRTIEAQNNIDEVCYSYAYEERNGGIYKSDDYFRCVKVQEKINHFFEVIEPAVAHQDLVLNLYLRLTAAIRLVRERKYYEAENELRLALQEIQEKWKNT